MTMLQRIACVLSIVGLLAITGCGLVGSGGGGGGDDGDGGENQAVLVVSPDKSSLA